MSLNWKEINAILDELKLEGCLLQQIDQPMHWMIVFHLHDPGRSFRLLVSLAQTHCRLHTISREYRNPEKPQRFAGLLRARLKGGTIREARQIGRERIIRLVIARREEEITVWIRLWGSATNMIVTNKEGEILDACYRRPRRGEMTGETYDPETDLLKGKKGSSKEKEFEIRDFPGTGSFNERVEAWYSGQEEGVEKEKIRKNIQALLTERENYLMGVLEKNRELQEKNLRYERFREQGDLIIGSLHRIKKGDKWVTVEDYYHENVSVQIELDIGRTPSENAEHYFTEYRKARQDLERTTETILQAEKNLENVQKRWRELDAADDYGSLKELERHLKKAKKQVPVKTGEEMPGLSFSSRDFTLLVGRTSKENDALLRKYVRGNDYWFHSRDYPGAYVFIKAKPKKTLPLEVMLDAGNLAIHFSKGKQSGQGNVYYTQVKYLRRVKGGKTGLVIPTQEKNLFIRLEENRIEALKNSREI